MPLKIELFDTRSRAWVELPKLRAEDKPTSISDNRRDGERDVYILLCRPDDSGSVIRQSIGGMDTATRSIREIDSDGLILVKELRRGDEPYELAVRTDSNPDKVRQLRLTHV